MVTKRNYKKEAEAAHSLIRKYRIQSDDQDKHIKWTHNWLMKELGDRRRDLNIILIHRAMVIIVLNILAFTELRIWAWGLLGGYFLYMLIETIVLMRRNKWPKTN